MIRYDLPEVIPEDHPGEHPFPTRIALFTEAFIDTTISYLVINDRAVEVGTGRGMQVMRIVDSLIEEGASKEDLYFALKFGAEHRDFFQAFTRQNATVLLMNEWEWFHSRLMSFARWALRHEGGSLPSTNRGIVGEIRRIEEVARQTLPLTDEERDALNELEMVRDLGMHHRWEMDRRYINANRLSEDYIGVLRIPRYDEIMNWKRTLAKTVQHCAMEMGRRFVEAPDYWGIDDASSIPKPD